VWCGVVLKEADIAAGALIVTDLRRRFVDFTEPFLSLRAAALIRKPLASSSSSRSRSSSSRPRHDRRRRPSTTSARPSRPARIHTAAELLASELSFGVVGGSVVERSLSTSDDRLTRALWSRVSSFWPPALVDSVQEGVQRARRQPYAFIVDSPIAAYVAGRRPCELYVTDPFLDQMTYAFAVRRGARRLRAALDRELRRMRASGKMQAMYLRWWRDECAHDDDDRADDVHIPATTRDTGGKLDRHEAGWSWSSDSPRTASRCMSLTVTLFTLLTFSDFVITSSL